MTNAQKTILQAIKQYIWVHGYPPTVREIGDAVGLKSSSSVTHHLCKMLEEGVIETDHPGAPRAIRVPGYEFREEE